MTHRYFMHRRFFTKQELLAYANGTLFEGQASLFSAPPILMFDRIVNVEHNDSGGRIVAEQDQSAEQSTDAWRPSIFGVDAIWQLLGFYLALRGAPGSGIPLGCKEISCIGQIRPHHACLRYEMNVRQVSQFRQSGAFVATGDGAILSGSESIYSVREAQVAVFPAIQKDSSASSSHRSSTPRLQADGVHHALA
jgi:3-hydroxyacyl-[acyl-carrier protein] dehydratase/trans-2-decenoyl-[acyl-carrier protein] isomerase